MSVDQWLGDFEEALASGDAAAASELFLQDSYWRDLIAFTWNIKTVEGPAGVRDMLEATLEHVQQHGFRTTEEPAEADGVDPGCWPQGRGAPGGPRSGARGHQTGSGGSWECGTPH